MKHSLIFTIIVLANSSLHAQICSAKAIPLQLAEPAVIAARKEFPNHQQARHRFIDAYCDAFLNRCRYGDRVDNIIHRFSEKASEKGYNAGLKASKRKSKHSSLSPSDFGYPIKTFVGIFSSDFEKSEFVVSGTKERFHLNLGQVESLPKGEIRIRGWVSPETSQGFGHFNEWKREIIVMEILNSEED